MERVAPYTGSGGDHAKALDEDETDEAVAAGYIKSPPRLMPGRACTKTSIVSPQLPVTRPTA